MVFGWLADLVVAFHLAFVAFVALGGLLVFRWPRIAWLHLPALAWGVLVEFAGLICPLTPLENHFRGLAGEAGYPGGFIAHYLLPILYPAGLTRPTQWLLGILLVALNGAIYGRLILRLRGTGTHRL